MGASTRTTWVSTDRGLHERRHAQDEGDVSNVRAYHVAQRNVPGPGEGRINPDDELRQARPNRYNGKPNDERGKPESPRP
jgi:hypothetical protein